ncbi:Protein ZINC INDUCED FACILITATOR-LIKE 1 OS=Arabidopsis thaliana GN=ZIFL1 PE=2 SV=1 [Rhizoctonia solani AG-1 IB]|uniref:Protein ZINC INDUCED FACILITATOR-LIKE 1 n=1 Tax=Thanatephorus cucumeris (strain AG1-IB / isolate 7/3/14) TaxID=1108050 RepID=A0A0B7FTQ8_THACB|nr:Protein ZINC INDUCED FACILITATOR-LIKE 1 OS=Arabidopsis thaliana GN=ZIFL1 PE=2 SV=1 [Rhizoctonia solani AG-1 IB]
MSDEQQPLLGPTHALHEDASLPPQAITDSTEHQNEDDKTTVPTPLPMKQILILLLMQLSEPLSYTVIYPFVAQFVNETGITGGDGSKVGYYAGMIESIFFLTESLFTLQYGRVSDRIGRRPVLMFGLLGQALSIFSVGLSKQFWQLVFSRALSGALNGNAGVAKSMVVELTDETNQAQAFAFLPIVWSTGSTLGPFLGGTLSHPAKLLPSVFDTPFWNEYPYFLPCLISAIYSACVFVVGTLFLKETHAVHTKKSENNVVEYGAAPVQPPQPRRSVSVRSVLTKRARAAIANYAFLAFSDITYLGLLPVVFAVSVENGGLGFSPRAIGFILGFQGVITGLVQVFFFAPIHRCLGSKRLYVTGYLCYSFLILSLPIMHALAVMEMRHAIWIVIGLHILLSCPAFMAFSCVAIYVNSSAPSKDSLGTLNGISQTIISVIRAIGPAAATSLFSLSVEKKIFGGNFVYAVLLAISLTGVYASRWLKEVKRAYR